jgi:hypothetical protein
MYAILHTKLNSVFVSPQTIYVYIYILRSHSDIIFYVYFIYSIVEKLFK